MAGMGQAAIAVDVGHKELTGSTRLKAGTAEIADLQHAQHRGHGAAGLCPRQSHV